jgi:cytochrome c553
MRVILIWKSAMRALLVLPLLLIAGGCSAPADTTQKGEIAALQAEIATLKAAKPAAAAEPPELGAQMLELQIRHARLWQAGQARNWVLTQFQLAELRESFAGIVETNGEHAALQPQRLAEVLPAMTDPALEQMQAAVDAQDGAKFDAAFDSLSAACTACHAASGHGFLVIQRPRTPILDNLRAEPVAGE